jgi:hypothetical protein
VLVVAAEVLDESCAEATLDEDAGLSEEAGTEEDSPVELDIDIDIDIAELVDWVVDTADAAGPSRPGTVTTMVPDASPAVAELADDVPVVADDVLAESLTGTVQPPTTSTAANRPAIRNCLARMIPFLPDRIFVTGEARGNTAPAR